MKEHQIPFTGAMVRAVQAGTKTQTRRLVRPPPRHVHDGVPYGAADPTGMGKGGTPIRCPYGQPGDRLWVREAWRSGKLTDRFPPREMTPHQVWYEADGVAPEAVNGRLRPAMFMPRWASRITLEITRVRVERLQDISTADAWAEGIPGVPPPGVYIERIDEWVRWSDGVMRDNPKEGYRDLWDSINAGGRPKLPANPRSKRYQRVQEWLAKNPDTSSWAANPWVWVVEFKVI